MCLFWGESFFRGRESCFRDFEDDSVVLRIVNSEKLIVSRRRSLYFSSCVFSSIAVGLGLICFCFGIVIFYVGVRCRIG